MVEVWLPGGGASSVGTVGSAFADTDTDAALADILRSGLKDSGIRVVSDERDINDDGFTLDIADWVMALVAALLWCHRKLGGSSAGYQKGSVCGR